MASRSRILIVDDERVLADTISEIFRSAGYETFTAYNGKLGLDAARTLAPQLVISDVSMPGLDGVAMAMAIRNVLPDVRILLFSGQANILDLLEKAEQKGFHFDLLQKPMPPEEMIRHVADVLEGSRANSEQPPTIH